MPMRPMRPLGETGVARDLGPGVAAVGGLVESAIGAAAFECPGLADDSPDGSVEDVGVAGIEDEVDGAGFVALVEDLLPSLAAVGGTEDAALFIGAGHVAERGDVDDVGILRMDADAADLLGVGESDVFPGAAGVGRFVDTVAVRGIAADAAFAHAGVDHVGIGIGYGDCADRAGLELAVGDGIPIGAAVGGFEDAAAGGAEIIDQWLCGDACDGDHAAATERSDETEFELFVGVGRGGGLG